MTGVESLVLLAILLAAVGTDLRARRIPNVIVVTGVATGFFIAAQAGWHAVALAAAGLATGLFLLLPAYAFASMGAGDVKLMATVGVFLGPWDTVLAVAATLVLGGLLGVLLLVRGGGGKKMLARYREMLSCLLATGRCSYVGPGPAETAGRPLPYAVAIACGATWALWHSGDLAGLASGLRSLLA